MQVIGSFFAAAIAWVVLEFVGRPSRKFFDLRGEIIQKLAEYDNVRARATETRPEQDYGVDNSIKLNEEELKRMDEAIKCFRDLAARMRAFAENETVALWGVRRLLRYDPAGASKALFGLSNSYSIYGKERTFHRKQLVAALRLSPYI
jgi:hypothetical protein